MPETKVNEFLWENDTKKDWIWNFRHDCTILSGWIKVGYLILVFNDLQTQIPLKLDSEFAFK